MMFQTSKYHIKSLANSLDKQSYGIKYERYLIMCLEMPVVHLCMSQIYLGIFISYWIKGIPNWIRYIFK